jgi:DNA replication and repair protein RecF
LASAAAIIHLERKRYLSLLYDHTQSFIDELSKGKEKIGISYESPLDGDHQKELYEAYKRLLTENWRKEFIVGYSLYGIHRDDVDLKINEKSARLFASQGQQRTVVLALKMAEGAVCRELSGEEPVFLLDDVLSELDENRRSFFLEGIHGPQILMTGCDRSLFSSDQTNMIEVKGGRYVSAHR